MRSRTDHREDDWFGVQDARKRKQIQDRLAQRAHRLPQTAPGKFTEMYPGKRLAERSRNLEKDETTVVPDSSAQVPKWNGGLVGYEDFTMSQDMAILQYPSQADSSAMEGDAPGNYERGQVLNAGYPIIPHGSSSVFTALYYNGVILGIPCSCTAASKLRLAESNIPPSLQPIPLQLDTVHYELIDRFPFPRMRYNMINLFDHYSIEDFVADLFMTSTFTIKLGGESWDPRAWRIDVDFKAKWRFLLAESI